jgi:hypothetical protein
MVNKHPDVALPIFKSALEQAQAALEDTDGGPEAA